MANSRNSASQEQKATPGAPSFPVFLCWPLSECICRLGVFPALLSLASPFTHWLSKRLTSGRGCSQTANKRAGLYSKVNVSLHTWNYFLLRFLAGCFFKDFPSKCKKSKAQRRVSGRRPHHPLVNRRMYGRTETEF